ncbi:hypothetical protein [Streptomyces sp. 11-1-2]|uniref:hypothetical protein n=1 Tax=unclassified Streptomyces TaxID=2593676 RepID=UPI0019696A3B|nr:hypothetical protein [Streptomyces sp. 11-1-2]
MSSPAAGRTAGQVVDGPPGRQRPRPPGRGRYSIESEFAALRCFALNGIDHQTHDEQNAAIAVHIRWYNARSEPKNRFAPESPIRQWTEYPAKAT